MIKLILASNRSILNGVDNVVCVCLWAISDHDEFEGGKHLLYILDIWLCSCLFIVFSSKDPNSSPVEKCNKVLVDLVHMNLCVLKNKDPSALDQSNRTTLNGKLELI